MFILEEYYPFQMLQIFAGVAPPAYRTNSKTKLIYWIITITSAVFQTGFGIVYMYWVLPNVIIYVNTVYATHKITEVEASNESTSIIFRICTSYLLNIVAFVLRVYNIARASKLSEIFEDINRIDSILRITNDYSKSSRRRIVGLVYLELFICWITQIPFFGLVIYGKFNNVLFYHLSLALAHFTITSVEWAQMIFFVLLKRRYSLLNEKLNFIHTSLTDRNHYQEAMITTESDDKEKETYRWSVSETVDNSLESGGKRHKICNYLNNVNRTFSAENRATSKINKQKVIIVSESTRAKNNSTRYQKKTISWQINSSNILRITTAQELEILRMVHQELSTALMRISSFFRFQIYLSFSTDVISLLDNLHYITQHLIQPWKADAPLRLLVRHPGVYLIWTFEYFTRITCIVWSNTSTNSEAKKTLLHLERLQVPLFTRKYQEALEELGYFKRYVFSEVAFSSSGGLIDFHGSLILRVIDILINYVFLMLQQTFRKK